MFFVFNVEVTILNDINLNNLIFNLLHNINYFTFYLKLVFKNFKFYEYIRENRKKDS